MSDRRIGIPHRIDEHWTPEQAAAVYECLSELTETILSHQVSTFTKLDVFLLEFDQER